MIIFYGILNKIIYKPIYKYITSNHIYILTFSNKLYILFLCKWLQIRQYLINKCINYNRLITSHCLKLVCRILSKLPLYLKYLR